MQITRSGRTTGSTMQMEALKAMIRAGIISAKDIEIFSQKLQAMFSNLGRSLQDFSKVLNECTYKIRKFDEQINQTVINEKHSVNPYSRSYKRNRFK